MLRSNHYDLAFAQYLQLRQIGYIAVDEHKRAQLAEESLKSLDFIVSVPGKKHLLIDIKGRKSSPQTPIKRQKVACTATNSSHAAHTSSTAGHAELYFTHQHSRLTNALSAKLPAVNWVTTDDLQGLTRWQQQFGQDFQSLFVFAHIIPANKLPGIHQDSLETSFVTYKNSSYYFSGITLQDYTLFMHMRSPRWHTWWLKHPDFRRLAKPVSCYL
jgi:hypothetical protein